MKKPRQKRPDAAENALPVKVKYISHGGGSQLLKDPLDMRTAVGRAYRASVKALEAHIGGDPTLPQQSLINQSVRLHLLAQIAWNELVKTGMFRDGQVAPSFDAFLKAIGQEREILKLLGLERKAKDVMTLQKALEAIDSES